VHNGQELHHSRVHNGQELHHSTVQIVAQRLGSGVCMCISSSLSLSFAVFPSLCLFLVVFLFFLSFSPSPLLVALTIGYVHLLLWLYNLSVIDCSWSLKKTGCFLLGSS
jgi:membrane-bound ClpP family serine protease